MVSATRYSIFRSRYSNQARYVILLPTMPAFPRTIVKVSGRSFHQGLSEPGSVHLIHTPAHKCALRAKEEGYDIGTFLRCSLALKSARLVEHSVIWSTVDDPGLLHQWCIDSTWGDSVDAHFPVAILLCSGSCQPNYAVLAGIVGAMLGESCSLYVRRGQVLCSNW